MSALLGFFNPPEVSIKVIPFLPSSLLLWHSLSRYMELERKNGCLSDIVYTRGVKSINHSQFLDDILLFCGASTIISRRFKIVLDNFPDATRGLINSKKCKYILEY